MSSSEDVWISMLFLFFVFFLTSAYGNTYFKCDAQYDELQITRQKTSSLEHFYYCFGYHHGKDRAWQMDHFRRIGQGRNAEVLGPGHLKADLMMRVLNLSEVAEKVWQEFRADKKEILQFYTDGVNEGFKTGKEAREFKTLDFFPERWRPQDTLLVLLLQSFDQTRKTFMRDYEEEKLKEKWEEKTSSLFDEDHMPWENTILKEGEYEKGPLPVKTTDKEVRPTSLWAEFPSVFGLESGSNNWVVSKAKTKNGKAIFANDPHLDLKTPLFWYWVNFSTPGFKVLGASVPGVPVVVSGTNGDVAWGLTNSYLNAADVFFLEDVKDSDIEEFRPTVNVRLWILKLPFFFKSFERLKTGQRLLPLENRQNHRVVLRWSGFGLTPADFYPMFDLFKMKDVGQMHSLVSSVGVPSWNFVYADKKGDIGYGVVGKTYRSTAKNPLGISTISREELGKEEFLTANERPALLRPSRGYIYSANNRHWPTDAKFYGGRGYSYSFRGFRIEELLAGTHDMESFKKIQCDNQVVDARFFLPKIQNILKVAEFDRWSMLAEDSSTSLPLYRRLMDLMMEKWGVNEYALYKMLDDLSEKQIGELRESYQLAKKEVGGRSWGEILRLPFTHLSKSEVFDFSPELSGVGDTHSVNPGTARWNAEKKVYEQYSGASMRLIIEMDEKPKIWLSLPGLNRDYDQKTNFSPWEEWKNCHYREVKNF